MKKIMMFALGFGLLSSQAAFAGYMGTACEAFRVSQDSNQNIQVLKLDDDALEINKNSFELVEGGTRDLVPSSPSEAVFKSQDGKGNLSLKVQVLSKVSEANGRLSIGRDHEVIVYKVKIEATRNAKKHEFIGTCKTELITTCGGECAEESEDRDEI